MITTPTFQPLVVPPLERATQRIGGRMRGRLFGLDPEAVLTRKEREGWRIADDVTREQLYSVWRAVAYGYNAAIREPRVAELSKLIGAVEPPFQGWSWEGAGIALVLMDRFVPTRRRVRAALCGPAFAHAGAFSIGVGWGLAAIRRVPARPPVDLDPLYGWMMYDGAGFHAGLFRTHRYLERQFLPAAPTHPRGIVFDHGLGRFLWWRHGADPHHIQTTINSFPRYRRARLWTGLALGASYAGGVAEPTLTILRDAAREHAAAMASGAALAAKARVHAGSHTEHTELACRVFAGAGTTEAARITDLALEGLTVPEGSCLYLAWRDRIGKMLTNQR